MLLTIIYTWQVMEITVLLTKLPTSDIMLSHIHLMKSWLCDMSEVGSKSWVYGHEWGEFLRYIGAAVHVYAVVWYFEALPLHYKVSIHSRYTAWMLVH